MDHGGDEARAIGYNVDHLVPKVFDGNPLKRLPMSPAYHFITLVHLPILPSFAESIISDADLLVNYFFMSLLVGS